MGSFKNQDLQNVELEILLTVDKITKELGIKYFMVGGTLLGAIRHKGFIPWDDDIDIGMSRVDYEKFIDEAQKLLPSHYFLQTHFTDAEFFLPFAKIRDSRTTFIESSSANLKINHGVYIDIFPFDFYHKESFLTKFKRNLLNQRILKKYNLTNYQTSIKQKALSLLSTIIYPSASYACTRLDKMNSMNKYNCLIINYNGAWGEKEIVESSIFDKIRYYEFEGHLLPGPENADDYLKHIYGDYMKLPPAEKRITHHYTDVIDLNNSYTHYMNHPYDISPSPGNKK